MGSKKAAPQVQTATSEPWGPQQAPLQDIFSQAKSLYYDQPTSYFSGSTVAGFAPEQEQAMQQITSRALSGSPLTSSGRGMLQNTIEGGYLQSNPAYGMLQDTAQGKYLNAPYLQEAFNQVRPSIDSQFAMGGRYGSGLHQTSQAEQFGQIAADRYGQERQNQLAAIAGLGGLYSDERGRQMSAINALPQFQASDYYDLDRLAGVGGQRQAMNQAQIDEEMARYEYDMNAKRNDLANYLAMIQGNYGGTQQQITPMYQNSGAGAVGGALGGAALMSQMGTLGGPVGIGLGALAGGFLGSR